MLVIATIASSDGSAWLIIPALLSYAVPIYVIVCYKRKCKRQIRARGLHNRLRVIEVHGISFRRRPLFWGLHFKGGIVFGFTAVDENQTALHGWVRADKLLWGLDSATIQVKWDNHEPTSKTSNRHGFDVIPLDKPVAPRDYGHPPPSL
jgi:hypothetical protein